MINKVSTGPEFPVISVLGKRMNHTLFLDHCAMGWITHTSVTSNSANPVSGWQKPDIIQEQINSLLIWAPSDSKNINIVKDNLIETH